MKGLLAHVLLATATLLTWLGPAAIGARAQTDEKLALHWVRGSQAEGCIDGARLARSLERRLGRPVFGSAADADAWLEGSVWARDGGGFEASLRWVDENGTRPGTRSLESAADTCDELSEALELVVAVMVDPEAALHPPDDAPPPASEQPPVPDAEAPTPDEPAPAPVAIEAPAAPSPPTRHTLGAVARLGLGWLPAAQVGLGAFYALDLPRRVRLRLEAVAFGQQSFPAEGSATVFLQPLVMAVSACPVLVQGKGLSLALCGGLMGGLLLQSTEGLDRNRSNPLGTLQGQAGLRGYWENERVRLGLGAALGVGLVRQYFFVLDEATNERLDVYRQGVFGADLDATIGVRF